MKISQNPRDDADESVQKNGITSILFLAKIILITPASESSSKTIRLDNEIRPTNEHLTRKFLFIGNI